MSEQFKKAFTNIKFVKKNWQFIDLRINIPPSSFGSDAANPHTQYSNPIAIFNCENFEAISASFTLGEGNQMVCEAADYIVRQFDGLCVSDLLASENGFYETVTNPIQLRWLSPNAGLPLMASGLVVNALIDAAAKECGLPAWEYLAKLPTEFLLDILRPRHLSHRYDRQELKKILDIGLIDINDRCKYLYEVGLPVYYTTWMGHDAPLIAKQIQEQYIQRGIKNFKIKIGKQIEQDIIKIKKIAEFIPKDVTLCVDANQTLSFEEAIRWMSTLSALGIRWLEEPFAPDNIQLFADLVKLKKLYGWNCEIVTGENCPNYYTAAALMASGIDRFQVDPCRMLGLLDSILTSCIAKIDGCTITPHAGGSSLDEQSPHIQLFNLARIQPNYRVMDSLTENVGFCSKYFASPTIVTDGMARTPRAPGLLVGLSSQVRANIKSYKDGITWLEL